MSILRIRTYGDPVLKQKAEAIADIDDKIRELARSMGETMYEANGIGLAAPQVGVSSRMIAVDVDWVKRNEDGTREHQGEPRRHLRIYVNPEIIDESEDDAAMTEGCLSLPGIEGEVFRPRRIRLRYRTLANEEMEEDLDGLLSRCVQHEMDHLDGVLFPDRMPFLKRTRIAGALNRLKKETLSSNMERETA